MRVDLKLKFTCYAGLFRRKGLTCACRNDPRGVGGHDRNGDGHDDVGNGAYNYGVSDDAHDARMTTMRMVMMVITMMRRVIIVRVLLLMVV